MLPRLPWWPTLSRSTAPSRPRMRLLGGETRVAGEERLEAAVLDQQHHRVLVHVRRPIPAHAGVGMEDGEPHAVEREALAGRPGVPADVAAGEERRETRGRRRPQPARPARPRGRPVPAEHARAARPDDRHERGRRPRPPAAGRPGRSQEGRHHAPAGVASLARRPGIDQHPAPAGRPDRRRVALPTSRKCNVRLGRRQPRPAGRPARAPSHSTATAEPAEPAAGLAQSVAGADGPETGDERRRARRRR